MQVWIGYHCYYNQAEVFKTVERVFDDEVKALLWSDDPEFNKNADRYRGDEQVEWREYVEMEVE